MPIRVLRESPAPLDTMIFKGILKVPTSEEAPNAEHDIETDGQVHHLISQNLPPEQSLPHQLEPANMELLCT